jgi:hypothetical protein
MPYHAMPAVCLSSALCCSRRADSRLPVWRLKGITLRTTVAACCAQGGRELFAGGRGGADVTADLAVAGLKVVRGNNWKVRPSSGLWHELAHSAKPWAVLRRG